MAPVTTSLGRLLDAVAALCGVRTHCTYEGQAAIELEAACAPGPVEPYPLPVTGSLVLDARPLVAAVVRDLAAGVEVPVVAARAHAGVAAATAEALLALAGARGLATAVLSGGVFQNRLLLDQATAHLTAAGLRVLTARAVPPNDGGIAFGQAAIAAARTA